MDSRLRGNDNKGVAVTIAYAEVIGDPIAHSKSPLIHNFWLKKLGVEAEYRKTHVRPDELAAYVAQRRDDPAWRGGNVTIPHKQAVIPLLDTLLRPASRVGAVNCIYRPQNRLIGENSDVDGVREAIGDPSGRTCLIGAGGAARAAMHALENAGVNDVAIVVRDVARGQALLESFGLSGSVHPLDDATTAMAGCDLLINSSPLGMDGQPPMPDALLEPLSATKPDALVFDMVYAPLDTMLLQQARRRGRRTADGLTMLIGQAAVAFRLFFGAPAPREYDADLRALLTA